MSGNYPDVPDHRMAWDKDGSLLIYIYDLGTVTELSHNDAITLNDETGSAVSLGHPNAATGPCVIFPELRDLGGYFVTWGTGNPLSMLVQTSINTTTGLDGTWVTLTPTGPYTTATEVRYRDSIVPCTVSAIRAIRFLPSGQTASGTAYYALHLYGNIHAGENPDRLALWHPTINEQVPAAYFDWGDVPRNSTGNRTFRVKNLSSTLTASTITCSIDTLTDTTPSVASQHTLSADGTAFTSTITVPDLAPGAVSGVLTLRRITPGDAVLSLWDLRLNATAASWA